MCTAWRGPGVLRVVLGEVSFREVRERLSEKVISEQRVEGGKEQAPEKSCRQREQLGVQEGVPRAESSLGTSGVRDAEP